MIINVKFIAYVFLLNMLLGLSISVAGDRSFAPVRQRPSSEPASLTPKEQTDGHSCGYLALAAVYESYGMNPKKARLRQRLGTDKRAVPFSHESIGTLQPDMLRVLNQDGFKADLLKLGNEYSNDRLIVHLLSGQYSLALIKRKENGNLHWVVLTGYGEGMITVGDSLVDHIYHEPITEFSKTNLLSAILLNPAITDSPKGHSRQHRQGFWEMVKTWWRK